MSFFKKLKTGLSELFVSKPIEEVKEVNEEKEGKEEKVVKPKDITYCNTCQKSVINAHVIKD